MRLLLLLLAAPLALSAQSAEVRSTKGVQPTKTKADTGKANKGEKKLADNAEAKKPDNPPLFRSETPLEMTFTTNIKAIKKDRSANAPWHPAAFAYTDSAGQKITVPVQIRTRGIWRLKNCDFPPIRVKVANKDAKKTVLHDVSEPKLVTFCRNSDTYESYVLQEAQLYRVYRLLTDASHKVRLVRLTYADSATGKVEATRWSFFIEDPSQLADRLGGGRIKQKGASADDLDPAASAIAYTFLYLIANTDVSFNGLHNGEIVALPNGNNVPIAYDFDFAGVINASYATPDPQLSIKSVRDRLFRGYCAHSAAYPAAFELFRQKRPAINALYTDQIGQLLGKGAVKSHLDFFDSFYESIKTDDIAKRRVLRDCV